MLVGTFKEQNSTKGNNEQSYQSEEYHNNFIRFVVFGMIFVRILIELSSQGCF